MPTPPTRASSTRAARAAAAAARAAAPCASPPSASPPAAAHYHLSRLIEAQRPPPPSRRAGLWDRLLSSAEAAAPPALKAPDDHTYTRPSPANSDSLARSLIEHALIDQANTISASFAIPIQLPRYARARAKRHRATSALVPVPRPLSPSDPHRLAPDLNHKPKSKSRARNSVNAGNPANTSTPALASLPPPDLPCLPSRAPTAPDDPSDINEPARPPSPIPLAQRLQNDRADEAIRNEANRRRPHRTVLVSSDESDAEHGNAQSAEPNPPARRNPQLPPNRQTRRARVRPPPPPSSPHPSLPPDSQLTTHPGHIISTPPLPRRPSAPSLRRTPDGLFVFPTRLRQHRETGPRKSVEFGASPPMSDRLLRRFTAPPSSPDPDVIEVAVTNIITTPAPAPIHLSHSVSPSTVNDLTTPAYDHPPHTDSSTFKPTPHGRGTRQKQLDSKIHSSLQTPPSHRTRRRTSLRGAPSSSPPTPLPPPPPPHGSPLPPISAMPHQPELQPSAATPHFTPPPPSLFPSPPPRSGPATGKLSSRRDRKSPEKRLKLSQAYGRRTITPPRRRAPPPTSNPRNKLRSSAIPMKPTTAVGKRQNHELRQRFTHMMDQASIQDDEIPTWKRIERASRSSGRPNTPGLHGTSPHRRDGSSSMDQWKSQSPAKRIAATATTMTSTTTSTRTARNKTSASEKAGNNPTMSRRIFRSSSKRQSNAGVTSKLRNARGGSDSPKFVCEIPRVVSNSGKRPRSSPSSSPPRRPRVGGSGKGPVIDVIDLDSTDLPEVAIATPQSPPFSPQASPQLPHLPPNLDGVLCEEHVYESAVAVAPFVANGTKWHSLPNNSDSGDDDDYLYIPRKQAVHLTRDEPPEKKRRTAKGRDGLNGYRMGIESEIGPVGGVFDSLLSKDEIVAAPSTRVTSYIGFESVMEDGMENRGSEFGGAAEKGSHKKEQAFFDTVGGMEKRVSLVTDEELGASPQPNVNLFSRDTKERAGDGGYARRDETKWGVGCSSESMSVGEACAYGREDFANSSVANTGGLDFFGRGGGQGHVYSDGLATSSDQCAAAVGGRMARADMDGQDRGGRGVEGETGVQLRLRVRPKRAGGGKVDEGKVEGKKDGEGAVVMLRLPRRLCEHSA